MSAMKRLTYLKKLWLAVVLSKIFRQWFFRRSSHMKSRWNGTDSSNGRNDLGETLSEFWNIYDVI